MSNNSSYVQKLCYRRLNIKIFSFLTIQMYIRSPSCERATFFGTVDPFVKIHLIPSSSPTCSPEPILFLLLKFNLSPYAPRELWGGQVRSVQPSLSNSFLIIDRLPCFVINGIMLAVHVIATVNQSSSILFFFFFYFAL